MVGTGWKAREILGLKPEAPPIMLGALLRGNRVSMQPQSNTVLSNAYNFSVCGADKTKGNPSVTNSEKRSAGFGWLSPGNEQVVDPVIPAASWSKLKKLDNKRN